MKLRRRQILHLAASAAILPVTSRFVWAENYPARPVHLIVGFFAGGLTDILSRILAERFAGRFGQQFIIENVAGAGTHGLAKCLALNGPRSTLIARHGLSRPSE